MNEMFCFQCEQAVDGKGCIKASACGKKSDVANNHDKLTSSLINLAISSNGKARVERLTYWLCKVFLPRLPT